MSSKATILAVGVIALDAALSLVPVIPHDQALFSRAFPGEAQPVNRLNVALAIAA